MAKNNVVTVQMTEELYQQALSGGGSSGGSSPEGLLENSYKTMVIDFDVWEATPYGSQKRALAI